MFPASFGAMHIPVCEEKQGHVYIRQDGYTKCVAVMVDGDLLVADRWTHRQSDVSNYWIVFQDTKELTEILDEASIYFDEEGEEDEKL